MEEKDWRILHMLSEEKNITKAAQKLYLSQPSITYRVQQIEKEFGVPLLIRKKTGVEFTEPGHSLVAYAKKMLTDLQNIKDQMANHSVTIKGTLRLGVSSTFARYKLPELLKNFLDDNPGVEINVKTGWSTDIIQCMIKEEVHIGIVRGEPRWIEEKRRLFSESIYIVSKHELDLNKLPTLPWINYQTDPAFKNVIDNWWLDNYPTLQPGITMEVDNLETCKAFVKQGLGYAVLPEISLQKTDQLCLHPMTTKEEFALRRNTWLIFRKEMLGLAVVTAFVNFIASYF